MAKATAVKKSATKKTAAKKGVVTKITLKVGKPAAKKVAAKPVAKKVAQKVLAKPAKALKTAKAAPAAKFAKGDKVTWTSSAGFSTTTKTGTIVAVIPAGHKGHDKVRSEINRLSKTHNTSTFGHGPGRDHESYLVSVPQGVTGKAKPKVYWPVVKRLSKA